MPRSRNVNGYPEAFFKLARAMLDNRIPKGGVLVGPMTINSAKATRQHWYAFVRAHQTSIDLGEKRRKAAFASKDKVALNLWSSRIRSWEIEYETTLRYQVVLEVNPEIGVDEASLRFQRKDETMTALETALQGIGASHERIEDMMLALDSAYDSKKISHHIPGTKEVNLRDDPVLGEFFTMPDHDRLRLGSMQTEEIKPYRARCTAEEWATIVAAITDETVLAQINEALSEASPPDVDSGAA